MKIDYNGKEVEAYRLITKRKFAQDIFDGKKTVEIRTYSNFFINMFIDPDKAEALTKSIESGGEPVRNDGAYLVDDTIRDTEFARLTNYSGSWYLDIRITSISVCSMVKDDIEYLNKYFDFHDYDGEYKKYENYPVDKIPMFFAIAIRDITASKGLQSKLK